MLMTWYLSHFRLLSWNLKLSNETPPKYNLKMFRKIRGGKKRYPKTILLCLIVSKFLQTKTQVPHIEANSPNSVVQDDHLRNDWYKHLFLQIYCEWITTCWSSSSVPKYRSPNSPMPGMTRKSSFKPISISDVTIFSLGKLLQTTCTPWGAWWDSETESADEKISKETLKEIQKETFEDSKILKLLTDMRFRNMMLDSGTPFLRSKEIAWTAELPEWREW